MQELQSDDLYIPEFLAKLLPKPGTDQRESQAEDFLKGLKGWAEKFPLDECVE